MIFTVDIDTKKINIKLVNKRSVKHCYLRIVENSMLQITANIYFTKDDAKKLVENKKNWILKHLNKSSNSLGEGEYCYLGKIYKSQFLDEKGIIEFYKDKVHEIITPIVKEKSEIMQLYPISLKYRNNKSRWGSCSHKNGIILNINLLKFPIEVIEYVVVHELAHIKEKNHSKKFWDLVEKYSPEYKKCEKILKNF